MRVVWLPRGRSVPVAIEFVFDITGSVDKIDLTISNNLVVPSIVTRH